ncbi:MAG: hypothetical protein ABJO52_23415 [Nisaea sp.]|uniref:hypothetical protein n=1 Tax=Alphaproteobacteria TaxID=28211 RepID=UPI003298CEAD
MGNLYEALGFMAMLFGLAVVADRLTSKEARKRIGDNIRSTIEHPKSSNFRNPVGFIEQIRPFSPRSFLVSTAFSFYAFAVVLYIQFFLLGYDFLKVSEGLPEAHILPFMIFLLFMFASNFFVDYLSFTQTLVLIRLINRGQSKGSVFVVFFTDLLASINIFTFAYAAFLAFGVLCITNGREVAEFVVAVDRGEVTDPVGDAVEKTLQIEGEFQNQYTIKIYELNEENARSTATVYFVSKDELSNLQLQRGFGQALQTLFPADNVTLNSETGLAPAQETASWGPVDYEMLGSIEYWWNEPLGFLNWYSSAYLVTDDVQDNFFVVATLSPGFQPLDLLRDSGNQRALNLSAANYFTTWCADSTSETDACENEVGMLSNDLGIFRQQIALTKEYGGSLPLYTFFFTSLALTVTIYLFYISILMLRYSAIFARRLSIPISRAANFDEHPVTVAAFPVVIIATIIFYIAGL